MSSLEKNYDKITYNTQNSHLICDVKEFYDIMLCSYKQLYKHFIVFA